VKLEHPYINLYVFKCPDCSRPITAVWRTRTAEEGSGTVNRLSCQCGWEGALRADTAEARIHQLWPHDVTSAARSSSSGKPK
jgi:predicted RNA-binding Zn-ribbon protein involved in translation (DUF1610 family)